MIFGYLFWQDVPSAKSLLGIAIIIACGLFIFYREGRAARPGAP